MSMDFQQKQHLIITLREQYQAFSSAFNNADVLKELDVMLSSFEKDIENAQNEQRLLRIGIIGQIRGRYDTT